MLNLDFFQPLSNHTYISYLGKPYTEHVIVLLYSSQETLHSDFDL